MAQQPAQPKKRPQMLVIAGVAAGLLVAMCLCLVVIGALAPDSDDGVVSAPAAVEEVIAEAQPTATAVQPAAPTDTPPPAPTVAATDTAAPAPAVSSTDTPGSAPTNTPVPPPTSTPPPVPTATATSVPAAVPAGAVAAQLADVVDGDTIDVLIGGQEVTVRLIGIDTPERGDPGYGAATEANAALLGSGELYLVADTSERDRYGRLLRYVYTDDGVMVNREMVAQGWAQPVEYPPDTAYAAEFLTLAGEAAETELGFWDGEASDGAAPYALTAGSANIRSGPGTTFEVNTTASPNTPLAVVGRTPDGEWLQVRTPDLTDGWISVGLVALNVAASQVSIAADIPVAPVTTQAGGTRGEPVPLPTAPPPPAQAATGGAVQIVQLNPSGDDETVVIQNTGAKPVDLSGWSIQSYGGSTCAPVLDQVFTFPGGFQLAAGASVRVHSGPQAFGNPPGDLLWITDNIWNNGGDRADLRDAGGQVVSTTAYGGCG